MSVESPDYENALWSENFYSSPAVLTQSSSSNHLQSLKKSVNIPNSTSLQSLAGYVPTAQDSAPRDPEPAHKTSLMKISPSLKALENILNSDSAPVAVADTIPEEDESSPVLQAPPVLKDPAYSPAPIQNSDSSEPSSSRRPSAAKTASSVSTSKTVDSGSTIKAHDHSSYPIPAGQSPTITTTKPSASLEQSDGSIAESPTLSVADEHQPHEISGDAKGNPSEESQAQTKSTAADVPQSKKLAPPPPLKITVPKRSMLDVTSFSASPKKELPQVKEVLQPPVVLENSRSTSTPVVPSKKPEAKKPEPKKTPSSPAVHKRSNTMGNIAGSVNTSAERPNASKRFSFRGLFKMKSKNHSLSKLKESEEEIGPSVPVKLSAKSFSTPNISSLSKNEPVAESKPKSPGPKRNLFAKKKKTAEPQVPTKDQDVAPAPIEKASTPSPAPATAVSQEDDVKSGVSMGESKSAAPPLSSQAPSTPMGTSSVLTTETPPTGALDPSKTIREVDDSDYSPNITRDDPSAIPDYRYSPSSFGSPALGLGVPSLYLNGSLDPQGGTVFGSPFEVQYPGMSRDSNLSSPRMSPTKSSSIKSPVSPGGKDQLVGEALFPKSLNPQEIESIVSLERSMSMHSIRSSKRSSFMNYRGSDENIILAGDPSIIRQGSMKRSGSILKNSSSSRSLRGELLQRFNQTPEPQGETTSVSENPEDLTSEQEDKNHLDLDYTEDNLSFVSGDSKNSYRYSDFIEFSDYLDVDNLDFTTSPRAETNSVRSPVLTRVETDHSHTYPNPDSFVLDGEKEEKESTFVQPSPQESKFGPEITSLKASSPSAPIVVVSSQSSSEAEKSLASPAVLQTAFEPTTPEVTSATSPLDKTFEFTIENVQQRNSPGTQSRPISMSFKGFSGSTFKDKIMPHSGSHQSIQFDDDSLDENSAVGQGFGTSEDEDSEDEEDEEDDGFSMAILEHNRQKRILGESASVNIQPKSMNNSELRRQQHLKNVLSLQPPPSSLPFHHDRIPSLSGQSNASSPRSLTSFISKMRKSPLNSPKVAPPRRTVKFSSRIVLYDTYHHDEYDRHPEIATCNQLTPQLAQQIKEELNDVKASMEVHEDSICYTQFF